MHLGGRRIGRRIGRSIYGRVAGLKNRLVRARYFRGHGVHSPFVYAIVRQVFMRHDLLPGDRELYGALCAAGVGHRRAVQLQNLFIHCGYHTFAMNRTGVDLCVVGRSLPEEEVLALVDQARRCGTTLVLLEPYADEERCRLCRRIVAAHGCASVDNRAYLLIFNNYLPKQHFRI